MEHGAHFLILYYPYPGRVAGSARTENLHPNPRLSPCISQLLRRCGCDMNQCDYDGRTPMMLAAADGNLLCVHYLLYAGALVHAKDRWGGTALCDAVCDPPPRDCLCAPCYAPCGGQTLRGSSRSGGGTRPEDGGDRVMG